MNESLAHADVLSFLRGARDLFYFMPGQRYLGALGHVFFGATIGHFWVLVFALPLVFYRLLKTIFRWEVAVALTLLFVLLRTSPGFFFYVGLSFRNVAEPNAALFFFAGLLISLSGRDLCGKTHNALRFCEGTALSLAIVLRPELSLAVVTLYLFRALQLAGHPAALLALGAGSLPALLPLAHNWFFGGAAVLFTTSIDQPFNTRCPPGTYLAMAGELWNVSVGTATRTVWRQWSLWLENPFHWFLLLGHLSACFEKWANPRLSFLPWVGFALHVPAWIWMPNGRYTLLAWTVSMILTMTVSVRLLARKFPRFAPAAG